MALGPFAEGFGRSLSLGAQLGLQYQREAREAERFEYLKQKDDRDQGLKVIESLGNIYKSPTSMGVKKAQTKFLFDHLEKATGKPINPEIREVFQKANDEDMGMILNQATSMFKTDPTMGISLLMQGLGMDANKAMDYFVNYGKLQEQQLDYQANVEAGLGPAPTTPGPSPSTTGPPSPDTAGPARARHATGPSSKRRPQRQGAFPPTSSVPSMMPSRIALQSAGPQSRRRQRHAAVDARTDRARGYGVDHAFDPRAPPRRRHLRQQIDTLAAMSKRAHGLSCRGEESERGAIQRARPMRQRWSRNMSGSGGSCRLAAWWPARGGRRATSAGGPRPSGRHRPDARRDAGDSRH